MKDEVEEEPKLELLDVKLPSVAIQRLIDEIKLAEKDIESCTGVHSYNRIYNRHNRS